MILPTKHISTPISLIGVGAFLLTQLDRPNTISALWEKSRESTQIGTFERFVLGLDFLYMLGAIDFQDNILRKLK